MISSCLTVNGVSRPSNSMVVENVSISVATSARVGVAAIISAHMDSAEKKREEKEKMVMVVRFL